MDSPWVDAALHEFGAVLTADLPGLLTDVADLLRSQWPDYAQFLDENGRNVADAAAPFVRRLVETAQRGLANLDPVPLEADPTVQLVFEQIGRQEWRDGRKLIELLSAYRVGARAAWQHVSATALRLEMPPDVLAALAEAVFVFVDQLSAASAQGYTDEQSHSSAERERLRCELSELLLSNRSDTSTVRLAAEHANWQLPSEAALVLVDASNVTARTVIEHLDHRCLPVKQDTLYGAIMPGPFGPARREEVTRMLRGANAVVGHFVPLEAFPASARLPQIAMDLQRRGLLDGDPVFVSEHLDTIIARRDEETFDTLRRQVLRPLDELPPATRARLTETLAAWLRQMGDRNAVADELFIHPQTVRYRVTQLREHFGAELDSPRARARMLLALEWGAGPTTRR